MKSRKYGHFQKIDELFKVEPLSNVVYVLYRVVYSLYT